MLGIDVVERDSVVLPKPQVNDFMACRACLTPDEGSLPAGEAEVPYVCLRVLPLCNSVCEDTEKTNAMSQNHGRKLLIITS